MSELKRRSLLGRLAELGWFAQNGEVAATQSLAVLLENSELRTVFLEHVGRTVGVDLNSVTRFASESVHADGTRTDLEGLDNDGHPRLIVEAKFTASLTAGQVLAYLEIQEQLLPPAQPGAMVVLVPSSRVGEAERVLVEANRQHSERYPDARSSTAVITWDQWLDVWDGAVDGISEGAGSIRSDLLQLRDMCRTLSGFVITPFGDAAEGSAWRARREDLHQIVNQVTAQFWIGEPRVAPQADEPGYWSRRYFPGSASIADCAAAVGIVPAAADAGGPPIWLRYHKHTPGFTRVRAAIMKSAFAPLVRTEGGHVWLPLPIDTQATGPDVVNQLLGQVEEIQAVTADVGPA